MLREIFVGCAALAFPVALTGGCADEEAATIQPEAGTAGGGQDGTGGRATGGRAAGGARTSGGAGGASVTTGGRTATSGGAGGRPATGGVAGSEAGPPDAGPDGSPADARPSDSGASDAQDSSAVPDAEPDASAVPACLVLGPADAGAWAPVPTPGSAACVPNCSAPSCQARCTTGVPCATGCCAGAVSQSQLPVFGSATLRPEIKTDASGKWHLVVTGGDGEPNYVFGDGTGSLGYVGIRDPEFVRRDPFDASYLSAPSRLHVAVPPSGSPVHFAHWMGFIGTADIRYGTLTGSTWSFEKLPWQTNWDIDLELDHDGRPLILTHSALYHRTAGGWRIEPTPCGSNYRELVVDSEGAWYFFVETANALILARRSVSGGWTLTDLPAAARAKNSGSQHLHVGTGTAHVSWVDTVGLYYSRLVGTTWETETAITFSSVNAPREVKNIWEYQFDLDACGSPHFMLGGETYQSGLGSFILGNDYVRWTSAGWRDWPLPLGCNESVPLAIAVGSSAAYLASVECGIQFTPVPLNGP
jgi:hypothetical protein